MQESEVMELSEHELETFVKIKEIYQKLTQIHELIQEICNIIDELESRKVERHFFIDEVVSRLRFYISTHVDRILTNLFSEKERNKESTLHV